MLDAHVHIPHTDTRTPSNKLINLWFFYFTYHFERKINDYFDSNTFGMQKHFISDLTLCAEALIVWCIILLLNRVKSKLIFIYLELAFSLALPLFCWVQWAHLYVGCKLDTAYLSSLHSIGSVKSIYVWECEWLWYAAYWIYIYFLRISYADQKAFTVLHKIWL